MGLFGLVMLLVVVAVVALAVFGAVRLIRRPGANGTPVRGDQALDGLRQRYAAGEIDKQEYDRSVAGVR